jgi:hypothetical protein
VTKASELRPCPFCGTSLIWSDMYREYGHPTAKCILAGHTFKKGVIGQWNRRADTASTVTVKPLDVPALAREVANFPETITAHTVGAAIALENMDVLQRLVRVEDVGAYIDRILAALQGTHHG